MIKKLFNNILLACLLLACSTEKETTVDFYTSALFHDVQMAAVFPDSKTFADCVAKKSLAEIVKEYDTQKKNGSVDLKKFVADNFDLPNRPVSSFQTDKMLSLDQHLDQLWPALTREADVPDPNSSLLALPNAYIVPGGRFSEIYYWDSYFTMLGLLAQGKVDIATNMVKNFAYLLDTYGHIPNGNRNYYISRSQPPFFCLMVKELAKVDTIALMTYKSQLEKEYAFWMQGIDSVQTPGDSHKRVVVMPDGTIMNRYWDDKPLPRPEAYKEDVSLQQTSRREEEQMYRDLRAAAESGWDFSTRWLADGKTLSSIQTTQIIPVDLNSLLVDVETTLASIYAKSGESAEQRKLQQRARERRRAINTFMWDVTNNFYTDYNFATSQYTGVKTLAGMFPFYFRLSQSDLAAKAFISIEKEFLQPGGLVTTLDNSGQQWDAPNGWAPLQWIAYKALVNYNNAELALKVKNRWMKTNERVFRQTGKMMEKYNVMDTTLIGGGGEYPNQDGFGWTNGVYLVMQEER
jgi:alpha,alpha-trehalase